MFINWVVRMVTRRVGRDIVVTDWGGLILDCGSKSDCDERLHFDL
jgi:ribose 5-phosphate isomerase